MNKPDALDNIMKILVVILGILGVFMLGLLDAAVIMAIKTMIAQGGCL